MKNPRVLVGEPDVPVRTGLRTALTRAGFEVAAEPPDADAAAHAASVARPDIALVAIDLPGGGLAAARAIARRRPGMPIVILTSRAHGAELVEAVLAGAVGYLSRDMHLERLPDALRGVLAGEVALPRAHLGELLEALRRRDARRAALASRTGAVLSEREWEVLQLLADDLATVQIARRLGISAVTARRHVSSLMAKLGVKDRAAAVALVRRS